MAVLSPLLISMLTLLLTLCLITQILLTQRLKLLSLLAVVVGTAANFDEIMTMDVDEMLPLLIQLLLLILLNVFPSMLLMMMSPTKL